MESAGSAPNRGIRILLAGPGEVVALATFGSLLARLSARRVDAGPTRFVHTT
jgi:hypothetical protein